MRYCIIKIYPLTIKTERLTLIALDARMLSLLVNDLPALEKELSCTYRATPMKGFFLEIVKGQLTATESDPLNYMWHSFWLMLRDSDRVVVGSADFKKPPDENGEVELGYGISPEFEHMGYMTECADAMCQWAKSQSGVKAVIAETELDNIPSHNVLKHCGFTEYRRGETLWWKL